MEICKAILKSGKNKDKRCLNKSKINEEFCGIHIANKKIKTNEENLENKEEYFPVDYTTANNKKDNKKTMHYLYENIPMYNSVESILNSELCNESQSKKGNVYEKLWDLVFKCGLYGDYSYEKYNHCYGNINTNYIKYISNLQVYLQNTNIFSKNFGGSSDITLQEKETGKYIFISSKFYSDDCLKTIKDYDIQDIMAITTVNKYTNFEIWLLVNNKNKVNDILNRSTNTNVHLKNNVKNILDLDDLQQYYKKLKNSFVSFEEVHKKFIGLKPYLIPKFHQNLFIKKTIDNMVLGEKNFLWAWKCRSGKTYGCAGLVLEYRNKFNKINCLIITPAPSETLKQFSEDVFFKYQDFNDKNFNIFEIKNGTELQKIKLETGNNVVICSKQLLDNYNGNEGIIISELKNLDIIFFDEAHFHGTTENSHKILDLYSTKNTVKIFLSATYSKPLNEWNIPENCCYFWDIEDERYCKDREVKKLIEKHGVTVESILNENNIESELKPYDVMPELHILTTVCNTNILKELIDEVRETSYGYSLEVLFSLTKNQNQFVFPQEVLKVLKYISGSGIMNKKYMENSIFNRIKTISKHYDSRTILTNNNFTSQLWFLPYGQGMTIDKVSLCLEEIMKHDNVLKDFEIISLNTKDGKTYKDIKHYINECEIKAKMNGKNGLIILVGKKCSLGITLPLVDVVILLNNIVSADTVYQMMYRSMSEGTNKKIGFVVDLNISRVLDMVLKYNINKNLNTEQKLEYIIRNNLVYIDDDFFNSKENKSKLVERLLQVWKKFDPITNLKNLLKKFKNSNIEISLEDQNLINKYFFSLSKDNIGEKINFDDFNIADKIKSGRERIYSYDKMTEYEKSYLTSESDTKEDKDEKENITEIKDKNNEVSFVKDVLPYVSLLSCILTINDTNKDFIDMLYFIKQNAYLLNIFNEQTLIWWNNKNIIDFIIKIINKYIYKESEIFDIIMNYKMNLQGLINTPIQLLNYINDCLKPKQVEKEKFGEVFTPMNIIEEMLDKLDQHHIITYNKSIFTIKDYKWFDPASGMGNFTIAIYYRLLKGLEQEITDVKKRKKHILENMLYMSELNEKNVFICKQIFNTEENHLNIYCGDTLLLNTEVVWGVKEFDIVIGNPPYNKGGIKSHTGNRLGEKNETIWPIFIEYSFEHLKNNGYLSFINPLSWLKKSHSLHYTLLEKHIVWLKIWDNSYSKSMLNADIPISIYVIHNKNNINNNTKVESFLKRRHLETKSDIYLDKKYSIPLAYHSIFRKLISFIEHNSLQLDIKSKTVKSSGVKFKLPVNYTDKDNYVVDTYTIKDGIIVKSTKEKHPDLKIKKLIIANKASFNGNFIDNGKLGLTGNHKFYITGDRLELLKKIFDFKLSGIISHFTKYGQDFLDKDSFSYIPDIRKLNINDITEEDFYVMIGLTNEEKNLIN